MRWSSVRRAFELVARIGADPAEGKEERVQRLIWAAPTGDPKAAKTKALTKDIGADQCPERRACAPVVLPAGITSRGGRRL